MKKSTTLLVAIALLGLAAGAGFAATRSAEKSDTRKVAIKRAASTQTAPTTTETPTATPTSPSEVVSPSTVTVPLSVQSTAAPAAGEQIKWQVISSGGNTASSPSYSLSSTVGQTSVGVSSSPSFTVRHGFWQNFATGSGCCVGTRGNADGDPGEGVDISDLQVYIDYLFFGGAPAACMDEFDTAGGDASVDIADLQAVIDFLFFGAGLPAC